MIPNVDAYRVTEPLYEPVRVVLTARGEPYSAAYVQGVSGGAFRTSGPCPCAPTCPEFSAGMETAELAALFGYRVEVYPLSADGIDLESEVQKVLARVREEVRRRPAGRALARLHDRRMGRRLRLRRDAAPALRPGLLRQHARDGVRPARRTRARYGASTSAPRWAPSSSARRSAASMPARPSWRRCGRPCATRARRAIRPVGGTPEQQEKMDVPQRAGCLRLVDRAPADGLGLLPRRDPQPPPRGARIPARDRAPLPRRPRALRARGRRLRGGC